MKKYLGVLVLLLVGLLVAMVGLTLVSEPEPEPEPEPLVGEAWCEMMMEKANSEWTDAEAKSFSLTCLVD